MAFSMFSSRCWTAAMSSNIGMDRSASKAQGEAHGQDQRCTEPPTMNHMHSLIAERGCGLALFDGWDLKLHILQISVVRPWAESTPDPDAGAPCTSARMQSSRWPVPPVWVGRDLARSRVPGSQDDGASGASVTATRRNEQLGWTLSACWHAAGNGWLCVVFSCDMVLDTDACSWPSDSDTKLFTCEPAFSWFLSNGWHWLPTVALLSVSSDTNVSAGWGAKACKQPGFLSMAARIRAFMSTRDKPLAVRCKWTGSFSSSLDNSCRAQSMLADMVLIKALLMRTAFPHLLWQPLIRENQLV